MNIRKVQIKQIPNGPSEWPDFWIKERSRENIRFESFCVHTITWNRVEQWQKSMAHFLEVPVKALGIGCEMTTYYDSKVH